MKLQVVVSDGTIRFYGDRDFFDLLSSEARRIASSSVGDYAEFQTAEIDGSMGSDGKKSEVEVFYTKDIFDFKTYQIIDSKEFDILFMAIEADDFEKIKVK